jgi:hypothetical protein
MSLLSIDIAKVKKLSLRDVKLPTPERREEPTTFAQVERPPTKEEIIYSKLVLKNPLLEELVERLDLVSNTTKEKIKKVDLGPEEPTLDPIAGPEEPGKTDTLKELTIKIIPEENSYSREEIIERIKEATKVNQERAERGFNLMLEANLIETSLTGDRYYLAGSTPF